MTTGEDGRYVLRDTVFRDFISRDPSAPFPAEEGRYALYLNPGCPWAHRTLIVRALKGLESIIDLYLLGVGPEGWTFTGEGGLFLTKDPIHGFKTLKELYHHADKNYSARYSVPVLFDKKRDTIVSNESAEIIRMFYTEFDHLLPEHLREANRPGGGLYPESLRKDIDELNAWMYDTVNFGVYKIGFATTQPAYEENVYPLFRSLDQLEERLGDGRRYLFGDHVTDSDVRLFTTIARFDAAYNPVFQCNLKCIRHDYPNLYLWFRRLYWDKAGDGETRGAFHRTTEPFIKTYGPEYARARHRIILKEAVPLIIPAGPAVLVDPLP